MNTCIIEIKGMTCAVCASRIEKEVKKIDGIDSIYVNFAGEKASVSYNPKKVNLASVYEAIEKAGYIAVKNENVKPPEKKSSCLFKIKNNNSLWGKFIIAVFFTFPLLYIAMVPMIKFINLPFSMQLHHIMSGNPLFYALLEMFLTIPVIACGYKFYTAGFKSFWRRNPNMDSLIAAGTTAAFLYSAYNTFLIYSGNFDAVHSLYYETAGIIITLILLGKSLEAESRGKTGEAVKKLMELSPSKAIIIKDGDETEIPSDDVKPGDIIIVKPGAKIPVDGIITEGFTFIDESLLTGESVPAEKKAGSLVYAASINTTGLIYFKTEKTGSDTLLGRIIKLVEEAQNSKAPIAKLADTVSGYFVPAVFVIAFVTGIAWFLAGGEVRPALMNMISVLVITCPCALGLATPAAVIIAAGKGAENGILIKSGEALEMAHKIDTVIFDKTGTITQGKPAVAGIISCEGINSENLLQLTASAEKGSEHPLGQAIVTEALNKGLEIFKTESFNSITGFGIEAVVSASKKIDVLAGNQKLLKERNIPFSELEEKAEKLAEEGKTPVFVAIDGKFSGIIAVADVIKPSGTEAVKILKKKDIEVIMITGDNRKTSLAVAKQAGIDQVMFEVLPHEKAECIKKLQAENKKVLMAGDGINDAPALATADVGVAVGSGTDIALESANIVLMHSDLLDVPAAIDLSRAAIKNIKQNLFWAFGYNVIGIPIAAMGFLNPIIAAAAMSFSSVSVLLNALRLKKFKPVYK